MQLSNKANNKDIGASAPLSPPGVVELDTKIGFPVVVVPEPSSLKFTSVASPAVTTNVSVEPGVLPSKLTGVIACGVWNDKSVRSVAYGPTLEAPSKSVSSELACSV